MMTLAPENTTPAQPADAAANPPPRSSFWAEVWSLLRRLSWKARTAFVVVLLGIALLISFAGKPANFRLTCQHSFRSAELSVWVDDDLVYSGKLSATTSKRFGLVGGKVQGSFARLLHVSEGKHRVRVRVYAPAEDFDQTRTTEAEFSPNLERTLALNCLSRSSLTLSWKTVLVAPRDVQPSWHVRYAKALFITLFGSILSALMGLVVQEVMAKMRLRQLGAPKT